MANNNQINTKIIIARGEKGNKGDTGYPTDEQVNEAVGSYLEDNNEQVSDAVSDWMDNHISQGYVVDDTLSVSGAAADAKVTGDEFSNIKDTLNEYREISKIDDYYINLTNDPVDIANPSSSLTGLAYSIVNCVEGDQFIINAVGAASGRAWGFLDSNYTVISMADANASISNLELTAPANAIKLVINDKGGLTSYKVGGDLLNRVNALETDVDNLKDAVDEIGSGLSETAKLALLNCFLHVAWTDEYGQNYYNELRNALNNSMPSQYPKIEAIFTSDGRTVYDKDALETLKLNLIVTYFEDENDSGTVLNNNAYTLNGSLSSGMNTISVTYNGLTDNFHVTATTAKYHYQYSENELIKKNGSPNGNGDQPLPWLDTSSANTRRSFASNYGSAKYAIGANRQFEDGLYLIPIPGDTTTASVSITPSSMYVALQVWEISSNLLSRSFVSPETGWHQGSTSGTWENPNNRLRLLSINVKQNNSGTAFTTEPTELIVQFS